MLKTKCLVEICCGSVDDCIQAEAGGANRIELNNGLFLGGLTPSIGTLIEARKQTKLPLMVMIRPRPGGFCYTPAEKLTMLADAEAAIQAGASGLVFGMLDQDGQIDLPGCRQFMEQVAGRVPVVFHRAFDVTPDPHAALETLIQLGICRVLTSGQKNHVLEALPLLADLQQQALGRIEILMLVPNPHVAEQVIAATGCTQVHTGFHRDIEEPSMQHNPGLTFGGSLFPAENRFSMTDTAKVQQLTRLLCH